ncbi:MAG: sterol desaturase family protein [Actinobacteria bacterium]|nr:sterol desaturase family protein [Actinomycetota bacterium]
MNPLWRWPMQPVAILRWLFGTYLFWQTAAWYAIGYVAWRFLTPRLDRFASLGLDDIGLLWVRNMLWSLGSAATVAALYEALMFRLYAGGSLPELDVWWTVALMAAAIPFIEGVHFYANHRLLHLDPLYSWFHALHHRNVNTGPWSGVSMSPGEHLLYLSTPFVFVLLPGHPYLVTFTLLYLLLSPSPSHSGFDRWKLFGTDIQGGDIFHNLHHRYFEVNYGMSLVPMDKWFGTWHDGSMEAHEVMKDRKRQTAEAKDTDAVVGD